MAKKKLMKEVKNTVKLGVVSMAGMGALGMLGGVAGPHAAGVIPIVGAGVGLANIGQMAKTGMAVVGTLPGEKKKKFKNKYINKIL